MLHSLKGTLLHEKPNILITKDRHLKLLLFFTVKLVLMDKESNPESVNKTRYKNTLYFLAFLDIATAIRTHVWPRSNERRNAAAKFC